MSHLRDIVHPRPMETAGFLVGEREPCITFATDAQLKQTGRNLVRLLPEEFAKHKLPKSWAAAIVLCPGDETTALASLATKHPQHMDRIHFYLHRDCDPRKVFKGWNEAGLALPSTWDVVSWKDLSRHFGSRLNLQCHDDFCTDPKCPIRER